MKRYTKKYDEMIYAFAFDFCLITEGYEKLTDMQRMIENNDKRMIEDIKLLGELAYNILYGKVKIVEEVEKCENES